MAIFEKKLTVLQKPDGEILELMDSEIDIVADIEAADAYNHELLLRMQIIKMTSPPPGMSGVSDLGRGKSVSAAGKACQPKLTLKTFDGRIINCCHYGRCT